MHARRLRGPPPAARGVPARRLARPDPDPGLLLPLPPRGLGAAARPAARPARRRRRPGQLGLRRHRRRGRPAAVPAAPQPRTGATGTAGSAGSAQRTGASPGRTTRPRASADGLTGPARAAAAPRRRPPPAPGGRPARRQHGRPPGPAVHRAPARPRRARRQSTPPSPDVTLPPLLPGLLPGPGHRQRGRRVDSATSPGRTDFPPKPVRRSRHARPVVCGRHAVRRTPTAAAPAACTACAGSAPAPGPSG